MVPELVPEKAMHTCMDAPCKRCVAASDRTRPATEYERRRLTGEEGSPLVRNPGNRSQSSKYRTVVEEIKTDDAMILMDPLAQAKLAGAANNSFC